MDFLNSVIVDMQRKNDELKAKLDLLESAGIFESLDINDMIMMNGVDRGKVAPRLFCDICDRWNSTVIPRLTTLSCNAVLDTFLLV